MTVQRLTAGGWHERTMTGERRTFQESAFCRRLRPRGRILDEPGYFVWGCSPIYGPDGDIHVFYARWPKTHGVKGLLIDSEIAHAVAEQPEGPYEPADPEVVLSGTGGDAWDALMAHNPSVHRVDDGYAMVYVGNSLSWTDSLVETTKIGLAVADSLSGPWTRPHDDPIIDRGPAGAWDSVSVDNPAFLQHPDGRYVVYYRAWTGRRTDERNDKLGVAIADDVEGPYHKHPENPIIDPTTLTDRRPVGLEDPCAFRDHGGIRLLARDFGIQGGRSAFSPGKGLLFDSPDGIRFSDSPTIAYHEADHYYDLAAADKDVGRYGRFERPKVLCRDGRPTHLFTTFRGGSSGTSTGHVFEIETPDA